jgi:tRNA N6-adenosine threonylcarbamoyltransferase
MKKLNKIICQQLEVFYQFVTVLLHWGILEALHSDYSITHPFPPYLHFSTPCGVKMTINTPVTPACLPCSPTTPVDRALADADLSPGQLTAVAVTVGPGLSLCLQVSVCVMQDQGAVKYSL